MRTLSVCVAALLFVAACEFPELPLVEPDAATPDADPDARYTISYELSGMWWNGNMAVSLEAPGYPEEPVTLQGDGTGTFATALKDGTSYVVRVVRTPALHACDVANGAGTVQGNTPAPVVITCTDEIGPAYSLWSPRPLAVAPDSDTIAVTLSILQQTLGVTILGPPTTRATTTNVFPEFDLVSRGEVSPRGYLPVSAGGAASQFRLNVIFSLGNEAMASDDRFSVTRMRGIAEQYAYLKSYEVSAGDAAGTAVAAQSGRVGDPPWPDAWIVYGAPGHDTGALDTGAVYTYIADDRPQDGVPTVGQDTITYPSVRQAGAQFGRSVALSNNSQLLVAGAPLEDAAENDAGAVYVFRRAVLGSGVPWSEEQRLVPNDPQPGMHFGHSVAVTPYLVFVGAPYADGVGAVYVFAHNSYWQQVAKITAPHPGAGDRFGWQVATFPYGGIAISAPLEDSGHAGVADTASDDDDAPDSGAVYVFRGTTWTLEKFIKSPNSSAGDRFGESMDSTVEPLSAAVAYDRIAVGAIGDSVGGSNGAAYVYRRHRDVTTVISGWTLEGTLTTPTMSPARLGDSISIHGNVVATGSIESTGSGTGAAYLFWKVGSQWEFEERIVAEHADALDGFGTSVELLDDRLVIGAPAEDGRRDNMTANDLVNSGAVYVFR